MTMTIPQRQTAHKSPHVVAGDTPQAATDPVALDLLADDEELRKELAQLAQDNQQLLAAMGLKPAAHEDAEPAGTPEDLLVENAVLRARVAELEEQLAAGSGDSSWAERQSEYEALLEEKSEVIRALHQKLQEHRDDGTEGSGRRGELPQQGELVELKAQLDAQREQLCDDEAALMQQMTQMEMTMSKERAELARQRAELQRLHSDIRHELEVAGRDGALRDRLATFQRRHQEVTGRKGTAASAEPAAAAPAPAAPAASDTPPPKKKNSGLLRRLFG
jgi:hypothetical protein